MSEGFIVFLELVQGLDLEFFIYLGLCLSPVLVIVFVAMQIKKRKP